MFQILDGRFAEATAWKSANTSSLSTSFAGLLDVLGGE